MFAIVTRAHCLINTLGRKKSGVFILLIYLSAESLIQYYLEWPSAGGRKSSQKPDNGQFPVRRHLDLCASLECNNNAAAYYALPLFAVLY